MWVLALYVCSSVFSYLQAYVLNGSHPAHGLPPARGRRGRRSTGCRCKYFDGMQRGELLSRVTNDIDNISQTLQQTMSQLLTSLLTVVGVVVMMFVISPLLAVIALVTIPLTLIITTVIAQALAEAVRRAVEAHRRAERPDRGGLHRSRPGQGVRPSPRGRGAVPAEERGDVPGELRRAVHLRHHHAGDDVRREPHVRRRSPSSAVCRSRPARCSSAT